MKPRTLLFVAQSRSTVHLHTWSWLFNHKTYAVRSHGDTRKLSNIPEVTWATRTYSSEQGQAQTLIYSWLGWDQGLQLSFPDLRDVALAKATGSVSGNREEQPWLLVSSGTLVLRSEQPHMWWESAGVQPAGQPTGTRGIDTSVCVSARTFTCTTGCEYSQSWKIW